MLTTEAKNHLVDFAMLAAPPALVLATALFIGSGPAPVGAAIDEESPITEILTNIQDARSVEPDAVLAMSYIDELDSRTFGISPMFRAKPEPEEPDEQAAPEPVVIEFNITLGAIMTASTGDTALINNKILKAGQPVGETGWSVVSIDGETREVAFKHEESGQTRTLKVKAPGASSTVESDD